MKKVNADPIPKQGCLLGIDYGEARIGLAICDALRISVNPLPQLDCRKRDWTQVGNDINKIISARLIIGLVLGMPYSLDGSEGRMAERVQEFARFLSKQTGLPFAFVDERFSSFAASEYMQERNIPITKRKGKLDSIAAALLLESYLQKTAK